MNEYKEKQYLEKISSSKKYLQSLIEEKTNATLSTLLGLAQSDTLKKAIIDKNLKNINLKQVSLVLRKNTNFKNVWFQLISKDGMSLQRSWSSKQGDYVLNHRIDLQDMLKNPRIHSSISVGIFDMTFKSMVPLYHNGEFIGILEAITHFNSISKKLADKNIETIILADKKYKKQLTKPFTKIFVDDYYVANLDANKMLLEHLEKEGVEQHIKEVESQNILFEEDIGRVTSYYRIDDIQGNVMGHFLLFYKVNSFSTSELKKIESLYNIYIFISLTLLFLIFIVSYNSKNKYDDYFKIKIIVTLAIIGVFVSSIFYFALLHNMNVTIKNYKNQIKNRAENNFHILLKQNKVFADHIFNKHINKAQTIKLFKNQNRDALHDYLKDDYEDWKKEFNIRQIHFHTKDVKSFLRMHKPGKFGDSLVNVRPSLTYVNQHQTYFEGFEEGRIFNGFRHVYPLFDEDDVFIGSVEVSFNANSVVDGFLQNFKKKANFLISAAVVDEKVFQSEKSSYAKSPIPGFYYDKVILKKSYLSDTKSTKNSQEQRKKVSVDILNGKAFVSHFKSAEELIVIIPIKNSILDKVVASITVSSDDAFIKEKNDKLIVVFIISLIILLLILVLIYKEIISRYVAVKNQKDANKKLELEILKALEENTKQQQALQQQSKMASMGEMIGAIAHQWRQPLNELGLSIQNLKYDYKADAIDEKFLEDFIAYNKRTIMFMSNTIDDFRSFFRVDKTKKDFGLKETTESVISMLSSQLNKYKIDISVRGEECIYNGFQSEYQQVVLNIVNNAKDAFIENKTQNPTIAITIEDKKVSIQDNAGGIPKDVIDRVFEPYFTTKEQGKGTGMGLYMSKMIVEDNMGGKLSVENIDGGTCFILDFNKLSD